ncbi:MAG TPA: SLBB domain-containing protein [Pyrinomonadaceae bacterium]|nr:SLBB domain-containing protein [Pyrinomonadaceae bacterium]
MQSKFLLAALVIFCLHFAAGAQSVPLDDSAQKGYLIGPGDEITGKVLGEPQFDFVATVDEDGKIEVPFFDKPILAKCRSEREMRSEISMLLSKYLRSPQASVRVTQRNSRPPVSIYGEVRQQQQVVLTRKAYLLELISFAGGVTEKSGGMIQVFRTRAPICAAPDAQNDWKAETSGGLDVPSRLYSLAALRQGHEAANPEIFAGDIIVVQKAAPVYVTGEVLRPGEMNIPEGGLPLTQAVAMASGITREAKTKNIKIYRRKIGSTEPQVLVANYDQIKKGEEKDIMLEPFDIVEVDKAAKKFTEYLLEFATGLPNRIPIRPF